MHVLSLFDHNPLCNFACGKQKEQQVELDDLQQQLQHAAAERERCANRAASTEQQLSLELHEATAALSEVRSALAGERGAHEALQLQHAQLAEAAGELKRAKKQLVCSLEEAEAQLTECEADRKTLRSKYISLGGFLLWDASGQSAQLLGPCRKIVQTMRCC